MNNPAQTTPAYRLSPLQRRWLAMRPNALADFHEVLLELPEPGPGASLEEALANLVARHDSLRTVFEHAPGRALPLQVVLPAGAPAFATLACSATASEAAAALARWRGQRAEQPEPLAAALLPLASGRCWLALSAAALNADRSSLIVLAEHLTQTLANARSAPTPAADDAETFQHLQFAEWQHELELDPEEEEGRRFWQERQAGAPLAPPQLPFEPYEPPAGDSLVVSPVEVPADALARLRSAAGSAEADERGTLLAAWLAVVQRLTGVEALELGCVLDGRQLEPLVDVVGLLAKALPCRFELPPRQTLAAWARHCTVELAAVNERQEHFFWAETTSPHPRPEPALQVEILEHALPTLASLGWQLLEVRAASRPARLRLVAAFLGDRLSLSIEHDPSRVSAAAATCLGKALQALLARLANALGTAVDDLDLGLDGLAPARAERVPLADSATLTESFARLAVERADSICLVEADEHLSRAELARQAHRLAAQLVQRGVGPDRAVALCLEQGLDLVIALLGTLEAGGCYLPLEASTPPARLARILATSQPTVLLTDSAGWARLPSDLQARALVWPPSGAPLADAEAPSPRREPAGSTNLAYLLFTSGSTGEPRGVGVEHRQVLAYLEAIVARLELPPDGRFALVSTLAADLGNTVLLPALFRGGCLHLLPAHKRLEPAAFAALLEEHAIEIVKIVPSHLGSLLGACRPQTLATLRTLVLGGESTPWSLRTTLRSLAPRCRVVNHYGPTETTVGAIATVPSNEPELLAPHPALGKPLASADVHICRRGLRPAADGEEGEIFIGGPSVARGYVGAPAATAARFLPDPFAVSPGSRLYRTGDLARRLPSGDIVFLGRSDHQIKLRGHRIELGEIERQLEGLAEIAEAVVTFEASSREEPRLVAYLVAQPGAAVLEPEELRARLRDRLPEVMLPSLVVWLERLPRTPNGKVDRQGLPQPSAAPPKATPAQPLRHLGEEVLSELWRDILKVARVGPSDHFFHLGGDSLQAIQLVSRINRTFEIDLPVQILFARPTFHELARGIEQRTRSGVLSAPAAITPLPDDVPKPLSFAQQRLWFLHQLEPHSSAYNTSAAVWLKGWLDVASLARALATVQDRHETLRTLLPNVDGQPAPQRLDPPTPSLPLLDLSALAPDLAESLVEDLAAEAAAIPFDLARDRPLRAYLLRVQPQRQLLLGVLHHIATDGWSNGVLIRELGTLYTHFARGGPALPPLPIQYADFAAWQRAVLSGEALERELAYWRRQLREAPATLDLPTDRPRPLQPGRAGARHGSALSEELSSAARRLARETATTPFMVLLATFAAVLGRWAQTEDVVVGTDVANRMRPEVEGLIGFFVNNLALRTDLSGNPSFRELLGRVRRLTLDAFAYQDAPFELVVKELLGERNRQQTPLFQVLFVMQNVPTTRLELPGLELEAASPELRSVKFDLAVFVTDAGPRFEVSWIFRTELFDLATIARWADRFALLLEQATSQPDQPLSRLELRTAEEIEAERSERDQRRHRLRQLANPQSRRTGNDTTPALD